MGKGMLIFIVICIILVIAFPFLWTIIIPTAIGLILYILFMKMFMGR